MLRYLFFAFLGLAACENKGESEPVAQETDSTQVVVAARVSRHALPFCPEVYEEGIELPITELKAQQDYIEEEIKQVQSDTIPDFQEKRRRLNDLDVAKSIMIDKLAYKIESICGSVDDSQPVELYDGNLGVSKEFVNSLSKSVGQLQWKYSFGNQFNSPGDSEGNVKGVRWCSGSLIAKDLFITAGHCFDRSGLSWRLPKKNGQIISSQQISQLMKVNFNYQLSAANRQIRADTIDYPVLELKEYRNGDLDYAIIRLGKDSQGNWPGDKFGILAISSDTLSQVGVAGIIQHPKGNPKVIEAGPVVFVVANLLGYNDIDTEGGSSGAAVISAKTNKIVGVHIQGGCDLNRSNFNSATPIRAILPFSPILQTCLLDTSDAADE